MSIKFRKDSVETMDIKCDSCGRVYTYIGKTHGDCVDTAAKKEGWIISSLYACPGCVEKARNGK